MSVLKSASKLIIGNLEKFFLWWGKVVTLHPYPVISSSILITAIASLGLLRFRQEHRASMLWISAQSEYNTNQAWVDEYFQKHERTERVLLKSHNILTAEALKKVINTHIYMYSMSMW